MSLNKFFNHNSTLENIKIEFAVSCFCRYNRNYPAAIYNLALLGMFYRKQACFFSVVKRSIMIKITALFLSRAVHYRLISVYEGNYILILYRRNIIWLYAATWNVRFYLIEKCRLWYIQIQKNNNWWLGVQLPIQSADETYVIIQTKNFVSHNQKNALIRPF